MSVAPPAPRQIILIGLAGVGKTTVGRALAERLHWEFVDTDDLVTKREGKTPADLISERGEPDFRRIEEEVVAEAAKRAPAVIATGGGVFISARNRRALGEQGMVCYLDATPSEIARRLRAHPEGPVRPLLGENVEERLRELEVERRPYYNHADLWVPVQSLAIGDASPDGAITIHETVARILRAWATDGPDLIARPRRLDRLAAEEPARGPAAIVDAENRRYPIWIAPGELRRLPDRLRQVGLDGRRVFLVSDNEVMERHGHTVAEALDTAGIAGASYLIPSGEQSKTQRLAGEIYRWLAEERAERRDIVLALGGGVVGDLAGYVAATYLRGMPLVQIPTSMLAINDASIGGKVAVDLAAGKNLVGAFHQPHAVVADIDTLRTLPRRSFIEGLAEVIKHAFILDPGLLDLLEQHAAALSSTSPDGDLLTEIIGRSARLKALIVSSDPKERGLRAILNYGHTIGHAIEQATGYTEYMHGEAVSIGMMAAARIARELGLIDEPLLERHADVLRAFGLPLVAPGLNSTVVLDAMRRDKKVDGGEMRFVLLEDVGRAVVRSDVPANLVQRTVQQIVRG